MMYSVYGGVEKAVTQEDQLTNEDSASTSFGQRDPVSYLISHPDVVIGSVLISLQYFEPQNILLNNFHPDLANALRRLRCWTWGDLATRRVDTILKQPGLSVGLSKQLLDAARNRNEIAARDFVAPPPKTSSNDDESKLSDSYSPVAALLNNPHLTIGAVLTPLWDLGNEAIPFASLDERSANALHDLGLATWKDLAACTTSKIWFVPTITKLHVVRIIEMAVKRADRDKAGSELGNPVPDSGQIDTISTEVVEPESILVADDQEPDVTALMASPQRAIGDVLPALKHLKQERINQTVFDQHLKDVLHAMSCWTWESLAKFTVATMRAIYSLNDETIRRILSAAAVRHSYESGVGDTGSVVNDGAPDATASGDPDPQPGSELDDQVAVVKNLMESPERIIGELLRVLPHLDHELIRLAELDERSANALRRLRCSTWADLAACTTSRIRNLVSVGELTVERILTAAAARNFNAALELGISHLPDPNIGGVAEPTYTPYAILLLSLGPILRDLAAWGIRERGLSTLGDLISFSPDIQGLPPDLASAFGRITSLELTEFLGTEGPELDRDLLIQFEKALGRGGKILIRREVPLDNPPTVQQIADEIGPTRERVRQIEALGRDEVSRLLATPEFAPIRWRADDLRSSLGVAVLAGSDHHIQSLNASVAGLTSPESSSAEDLLLWIAGPYQRDGDWLVLQGYSVKGIQGLFEQRMSNQVIVTNSEASSVLGELGISPLVTRTFLQNHPGLRFIGDDTFVKWFGTVSDKAEVVLSLVCQPLNCEQINAHIGEGHAKTTLQNALSADERFTCVDLARNFALTEWGYEEYSGIAEEMLERIDRDGGSIVLEELIEELVKQFGVKPNSVRMYARTPAFVIKNGRLSRRSEDSPYLPDNRVDRAKGVYVAADGRVIVHYITDKDVLRGSGRRFEESAAAALGMLPDSDLEFEGFGGMRVKVSWRAISTSGPALGSIRDFATKLELETGDKFRLVFDRSTMSCHVERATVETLAGATGLAFETGSELKTLATSLGVETGFVESSLRGRGDVDVAELISAGRGRWEPNGDFGGLFDG